MDYLPEKDAPPAKAGSLPPPLPTGAGEAAGSRRIIEGLVWAALFLLCAFTANRAPLLSLAGFVLFPVPLVMLVIRSGLKISLLFLACALALSAVIFSPLTTLQILLLHGVLGLSMGYLMRRSLPPLLTLSCSAALAALGLGTALLIRLSAAGYTLATLPAAMQASLEEYIALAGNAGYDITATTGVNAADFAADLLNKGLNILPAAVILAALTLSGLCLLIARLALKRLRQPLPPLQPFRQWHLNRLPAIVGLAGLLFLIYGQSNVPFLYISGLNIVYVLLPFIFIAGMAVIAWLFSLWQGKKWLKILLVVAALLWLWRFVLIAVAVSGLMDMLLDIRQQYTKRKRQGLNH